MQPLIRVAITLAVGSRVIIVTSEAARKRLIQAVKMAAIHCWRNIPTEMVREMIYWINQWPKTSAWRSCRSCSEMQTEQRARDQHLRVKLSVQHRRYSTREFELQAQFTRTVLDLTALSDHRSA